VGIPRRIRSSLVISERGRLKKYFVVSKLSENMHETPEGFLLCIGVPIARTGSMLYGEGETPLETGEDGTIEVSRAEEEVFRPQTIASFEGKPVTIAHPNEFVTADNWSRLAKGVVQNVRRGVGDQGDSLIADLLITDSIAIQLVKNGLREVSCGYEAEYTQTAEGKGTQANIIGNHVALVDEGRAGSEYAIKDHKGVKMDKKNLLEKLLAVVGITKDEAKKLVQDAEAPVVEKKEEKAADAPAYDAEALMKAVKDLNAIVSNMTSPTEAAVDTEKEMEEKPAKDAEVAPGLEERLTKLEAAVSKLLERESKEDEVPVVTDEDSEEEAMDEEMEGEEEAEDAMCTGDTASRAEILSPGLDTKGKTNDVKAKALKACYGTKEGKALIDQLNGGKAPAFDSAEKIEMLFTATSEVLKAQRNRDMTKTRQVRDQELVDGTPQERVMTPEKQNEMNEKFYKGAK
jgi:hypothetical protein